MTYKIEQIEGIAPEFVERLSVAGVNSSEDLLTRCATDEGRRQLAAHAGLSTEQLETWTHQADLMRVSGIGSEFGRLLESSGVQSVTELRDREPENVVNLLHRVNAERKLTRALPSLKTVAKWIRRARELEPVVRLRNVSRAEPMREPMHAAMSEPMDAPLQSDRDNRGFAGDPIVRTGRPW